MRTDRIDFDNPAANMYGFLPCPQCGGVYRCCYVREPRVIVCDSCGHRESLAEEDLPDEENL
jgi:hypothetical protein